jgi:Fur family transcriptional regulator, iron response regulator
LGLASTASVTAVDGATRFAPTLGTIYNTLNEFARCGLLREIAIYDAKLWYDTKTGPHFHLYREDTEELWDVLENGGRVSK